MHINYSLHKITDADNFSFDITDYSKFKYGDDSIAQQFGTSLAKGFIETHLEDLNITKQLVVISSPYCFIPTATFAMKNYFVFILNRWLATNNYPSLQEVKVHRTITYKEDYGALNAEERLKLIGNDSFHIDSSFLKDKVLLFLDDIRITGSHERMMTKMLEEYHLNNDCYLLYFAELVNKDIHPNIENFLNYFAVKSIFDLEGIINSDCFAINTRIVKFILNSEPNVFQVFIENQSLQFINLLYDMAIGNGYHTIDAYMTNLAFIRDNLLAERSIISS